MTQPSGSPAPESITSARSDTGPALARVKADRRDDAERLARVIRVRREFERGTSLTVGDVARRCGLARDACWRILCELEDDNVLELTWDGRFTLRG